MQRHSRSTRCAIPTEHRHNLLVPLRWVSLALRLNEVAARLRQGCPRTSRTSRMLFPDSGVLQRGRLSQHALPRSPPPPGLSLREPAAAPPPPASSVVTSAPPHRLLPCSPPAPSRLLPSRPARRLPASSGRVEERGRAARRPYQWAGRLSALPPLPRRSSPGARRGLGGPAMAPPAAAAGRGAGPCGGR